ncbi:hypothetical protein ES288_A05G422700v1 [Gossypium darwinii]|uniref:Peptidase C1A papain C-terminal domain-containing protein n=1 Tax=Gossypium darwinii TaxID=34276 RepID=A0A5D2GQX8_GOSDA|nr:hypothetical protein ES288_A05G422700v1 [Gossypium darwinii]
MASKNQLHHRFLYLALLFILGVCEATARAALEDASMYERRQQWMVQFGRDTNERQKRFQIFKQNVARIDSFNAANNKPYKLGVNLFEDLTNQEFTASRNGFKGHMCSNTTTTFKYENATALPSTVDWRKKGAVTPIKDQGQCGCCWAFSAVAAMEGVTKLTTGKLISLSEQELVDCDTKGEDQGCEGGLMDDAFQFIERNKGLTTESIYPYKGVDGTCNTNEEANHAAKINGFEDVPANSEDALQKSVANQPVSVAIDAGGFDFQFYSGGVFTGSCGTDLDHGVTAVEYGEDGGTKDVDAKEGLCGIAMQPSYPTA